MQAEVRVIQTRGFDRDYWLCRCQGFRVDTAEGRLGQVKELRYLSRPDRPDLLCIRTGLLARGLLPIPVGEVAEILPQEGRIVLRESASHLGHDKARHRWLGGALRHLGAASRQAGPEADVARQPGTPLHAQAQAPLVRVPHGLGLEPALLARAGASGALAAFARAPALRPDGP